MVHRCLVEGIGDDIFSHDDCVFKRKVKSDP